MRNRMGVLVGKNVTDPASFCDAKYTPQSVLLLPQSKLWIIAPTKAVVKADGDVKSRYVSIPSCVFD